MDYQEKVMVLKKYKAAEKLAKYYREEIEQYRASIGQAKVQQITDMPVAHGGGSDLSDYVVKLEEMYNKMYDQLLKAERMKTNIMVWCESLENVDERLIIQYHYLQNHKFGWIADEMHYSERTVIRKHDKAIFHLPDLEGNVPWL